MVEFCCAIVTHITVFTLVARLLLWDLAIDYRQRQHVELLLFVSWSLSRLYEQYVLDHLTSSDIIPHRNHLRLFYQEGKL